MTQIAPGIFKSEASIYYFAPTAVEQVAREAFGANVHVQPLIDALVETAKEKEIQDNARGSNSSLSSYPRRNRRRLALGSDS